MKKAACIMLLAILLAEGCMGPPDIPDIPPQEKLRLINGPQAGEGI